MSSLTVQRVTETMTIQKGNSFAFSTTMCLVFWSFSPAYAENQPWQENVISRENVEAEISGELNPDQLELLMDKGLALFTGKFTAADGAGRPAATQAIFPTKRRHLARNNFDRLPGPDASACASCHNDPIIGGAGDVTANVFVSEGFTNANFDTTDPQFSNERNTNHLMGAGLVELLAREMTRDLTNQRKEAIRKARSSGMPVKIDLETKSVSFGSIVAHPDGTVELNGLEGIDNDLNVRPFGQKGVFTSLRQFTVNAMNHHHGMQADERFGARWTGEIDFDEDGISSELLENEVSALVAWQATLHTPSQIEPENETWLAMSQKGEVLFGSIGCTSCHISKLPLESALFRDPSPFDVAGTLRQSEGNINVSYDLSVFGWVSNLERNEAGHYLIPLYSDLKRHRISDQQTSHFGNELLAQRFVERDEFQTTELWGVGSTAPYGHRGDLTTIDEAIRAHGGEAAATKSRYVKLPQEDRQSIIAFLRTLVIEP